MFCWNDYSRSFLGPGRIRGSRGHRGSRGQAIHDIHDVHLVHGFDFTDREMTLSTFSICLYNQIENVDIVDIVDNVDQSSKMSKICIYILFPAQTRWFSWFLAQKICILASNSQQYFLRRLQSFHLGNFRRLKFWLSYLIQYYCSIPLEAKFCTNHQNCH